MSGQDRVNQTNQNDKLGYKIVLERIITKCGVHDLMLNIIFMPMRDNASFILLVHGTETLLTGKPVRPKADSPQVTGTVTY